MKKMESKIVLCQKNIKVFLSDTLILDNGKKRRLDSDSSVINNDINNIYYLPENSSISLYPQMRESYIFDGISNCNIKINGKLNHLLIRKCNNLSINISQSIISGINFLFSGYITYNSETLNYISAEDSHDLNLNVEHYEKDNFRFNLHNSINMKINNYKLRCGYLLSSTNF